MATQQYEKNGKTFKRKRNGDFATDWEVIPFGDDNAFIKASAEEEDFTNVWEQAKTGTVQPRKRGGIIR